MNLRALGYVTRSCALALGLSPGCAGPVAPADAVDPSADIRVNPPGDGRTTSVRFLLADGACLPGEACAYPLGLAPVVELCNQLKDAPKPVAPLRAALAAFDAHAQAGPAK